MFMYGKKVCSHTCVIEREICYVHQQWFSLKIKQTHCHCLATTHPAGQTSRLSFIQRHPPLYVSPSLALKETHTHTHSRLVERGKGSCIIHPLKQSQQPDPGRRHADCKNTCRYYKIPLSDNCFIKLLVKIHWEISPLRHQTETRNS